MFADRRLLRLSLAGLLLVVPQFLGSVFLVEVLHSGSGMALPAAAALLALTQLLGALGRLGVGAWSDRAASRLSPLRIVAAAVGVGFEHAGWPAMLVLGAIAAAGALLALRRLREPVPAG